MRYGGCDDIENGLEALVVVNLFKDDAAIERNLDPSRPPRKLLQHGFKLRSRVVP